ncbi:25046_t:CDS:1 [Dentiscutata erythropus]|uniref:25046_t:CDS:1 n=1 Tax=Dentiscutata erythropus TaxID=1348616 RepID=A0A9N8VLQ1_9GLOM|nr:25046_t:CDS:1 [Dentiscutata erythropus]
MGSSIRIVKPFIFPRASSFIRTSEVLFLAKSFTFSPMVSSFTRVSPFRQDFRFSSSVDLSSHKVDSSSNDYIREDPILTHVINMVMRDGKKARARRYIADACLELRKQTNNDPLEIIKVAIDKTAPLAGLISRKKGSKVIQIPKPLNERQRNHKAIKWILEASDKKPGKKFSIRLANEFLAVINGQSLALQKKEQLHKLALTNRQNLPVKW